jgi:HSP20 family protein
MFVLDAAVTGKYEDVCQPGVEEEPMSVMRFDPFADFDRMAEQVFRGTGRQAARSMPMDAYRRDDRFFVHLDLPGVDPDSIELTTEQNVLTIRAERRFEPQEDDQVIVLERPQGVFTRQLFLSDALDADQIQASYDRGVLALEIPVAEQAKPRRIEVSTSGRGPDTIEGSATRSE